MNDWPGTLLFVYLTTDDSHFQLKIVGECVLELIKTTILS